MSTDAARVFERNVVVTVCDSAATESCPMWLGNAVNAHWSLPDPSQIAGADETAGEKFESVISTLESRIRELLSQPFETVNAEQFAEILKTIGEEI